MPGKTKAALLGALIGAVFAVGIEVTDVWLNDEAFFGSAKSWLVLVFLVAVMTWSQRRAYEKRIGIYGDRDDIDDQTGEV